MVDLNALKKPDTKKFQRRNEIRPFEDASSIEFFSEKNDCSLIVLATHNKKRPNNLTFIRTFNYKIYDMIELRLADNFKFLKDFRKATFQVGMKPLFTFNGPAFNTHPIYQHVKSLFLDFFRGQILDGLDVAGIQHVISLSVDEVDEERPLPKVHFRVYIIKTYRSDNPKLPRVELDEIGPRFDFIVGRRQAADPEMETEAFKVPKQLEARTKKNIETDLLGDKLGRVHVDKQDLNQLQTRKMKGLKNKFSSKEGEEDDDEDEDDDEEMDDDSEDDSGDDDDGDDDDEDMLSEEDIIEEVPSKKVRTK